MKTETIQLGSIEVAEGTNDRGDWKRFDVKDGNGRRFVTFVPAIGDAARGFAGQRVEIDFEEKERDGRPNDLILKAVRPAKADANGKEDVDWDAKERRIVRQACLKAAVAFGPYPSSSLPDAIKVAETFERWVYRTIEYQEPEDLLPDGFDEAVPF